MTTIPSSTAPLWSVRPATREHVPGILAIYNEAVVTTTASYDYEPRDLAHRMAWYEDHVANNYAIFAAITPTGEVVGWSSLSRFHDRMGYRFTAENSIYIAAPWRGQGIGTALMEPLIQAAIQRGLHSIIALIDASNQASIRLHAKFDFVHLGLFKEVGFKFNRWLDVVYMQRLLPKQV